MANSKFYTLFSACSKREIAGYHKFLRQTRKKREDLLCLLDHIRKAFRKSDAENELEISYCCQVVYGEETEENYRSVLNMMSELHLMLKEYLLSQRIKMNGLESRTLWLSILSEKGLEKQFSNQALIDISEYETRPKGSISDYLNLFILQHQYYYNITNISAVDGIVHIQKNVDALNRYLQVLKLRMLCEALHLKSKLPGESSVENLIKTLDIQNENISDENILPSLYKELRILLETNELEKFDKLADLISQNSDKINAKELDEFLLYLNSFLSIIGWANPAEENRERTHQLNKLLLENKVYFHQETMLIGHYLNIVTVACIMKDFEWASHFAERCKDLLPELTRQDASTLSKAIIHFEKREYNPLFKLLQGIESKDIYIQIRLKAFMVVCHYELKDTDKDLLEFCTSLELYLKRNMKLKQYKETVLSVIKMVKIVRMIQSAHVFKQAIIDQINSAPLPVFRHWLEEKVAGYKIR